ncbi:MAG TPA: DUF47 family protein [Candidatus Ozemobacteraceae bacterium]|nr:DUF47 family protein [Candidatus Ozemobacteraceae bacterium]
MFFNTSKEDKVIALMGKHLAEVKECLALFQSFMVLYCKEASEQELKDTSYKVHVKEHDADLKVKEIQRELIEGAFLPFYRENFLNIPELIDRIPGLAVKICKEITLQPLPIPGELKEFLLESTAAVLETFDEFLHLFEYVPNDLEKVIEVSQTVSKCEQKVDTLEWKSKSYLFKTNTTMDRLDKFFFKDLITLIADMADKIENVSDYIQLTMIKMKV